MVSVCFSVGSEWLFYKHPDFHTCCYSGRDWGPDRRPLHFHQPEDRETTKKLYRSSAQEVAKEHCASWGTNCYHG